MAESKGVSDYIIRDFLIPLHCNFATDFVFRGCMLRCPELIYHCDIVQIKKWLDLLDETLQDAPQIGTAGAEQVMKEKG